MNDYATNPNDIDAFATLIRDALPHVIEDGLCVECTEVLTLSARNPEDYPTGGTV